VTVHWAGGLVSTHSVQARATAGSPWTHSVLKRLQES